MQVYTPPPPQHVPAGYDLFMGSLSPLQLELMEYAKSALGSSFVLRFTHIYKEWKLSSDHAKA